MSNETGPRARVVDVAAGRERADDRLDLLDGLIYGDLFDCAVTFDELWRYARVAADRDELRRRLRDDPVLRRVVVEQDGFYCLDGRRALLSERPRRIARAGRLRRRAHVVARALRHVPFVNGLLLTGSVSADDATERADVDLLVIVAADRLGTAFLLLGSISRLLGRRFLCPNWYVSDGRLAMAPGSLYLARELAQARGLVGDADALRKANPWLAAAFPNAAALVAPDRGLAASTRLQRLLEALLRGGPGDRLERWARRVALLRLRAHYSRLGRDVPAEVAASFAAGAALCFHGYGYEQRIVEAHAARRSQVADRLEHERSRRDVV